MMRAGNSSKL